jgi:aspartyl-tRNA(Asn)/glutamyl-tRNA(Gln) amidotransferase subunit C
MFFLNGGNPVNKKIVMTKDKLIEVFDLSKIKLPSEAEFQKVLNKINELIYMCDDMRDLDLTKVNTFEWEMHSLPKRREDIPQIWDRRDSFLEKAPVSEGDFFRVPRIMALEESSSNGEIDE